MSYTINYGVWRDGSGWQPHNVVNDDAATLDEARDCAKLIGDFLTPSPESLAEMLAEAGALVIRDGSWVSNATAHVRAVASNVQQIVGNSGGD